MKRTFSLFLFLLILAFSSCDFIKSSFRHTDIAKAFISSILNKDYSNCIRMLDTNRGDSKRFGDTLQMLLEKIRTDVVTKFGDKLDISFAGNPQNVIFIGEEKKDSSNVSKLTIQIANDKEFGIFKFTFDNNTDKIKAFYYLHDIKEPIPSLALFWFSLGLCILVLAFNIYAMFKVKRSNLKWKFLFYFLIIIFNVPSIGYNTMSGYTFDPSSFQILLGLSFSKFGYIGTFAEFGIPLGAIFSLWKVYQKSKEPKEVEEENISDAPDEQATEENTQPEK